MVVGVLGRDLACFDEPVNRFVEPASVTPGGVTAQFRMSCPVALITEPCHDPLSNPAEVMLGGVVFGKDGPLGVVASAGPIGSGSPFREGVDHGLPGGVG